MKPEQVVLLENVEKEEANRYIHRGSGFEWWQSC